VSTKNPNQPWDRRADESRHAYAAFCAYRDLGPTRSQEKAYAALNPQKKRTNRISEYFKWFAKFEWVKRAEAFDAYAEEIQRREFEKRLKELAHQQADFAVEEFRRLVERVRKADRILDKADAHPISDVVQEQETVDKDGKPIGKKRTRIRGVNFAGYAALMKEIRESARRAILGPRDDAEPTAPANPAEDIEWEKPSERAA
jgi:hypothetical protein